MKLEGCMEVPDMTISVMKGQPDRVPARRWTPKCHPGFPPWSGCMCRRSKHEFGLIPRVEVERARMPAAELKKVVQESPKGHGARWKSGRVCGVELVAGQDQGRTAQAARAVSAVAGADEEESEERAVGEEEQAGCRL
jgi:hypothetical protein